MRLSTLALLPALSPLGLAAGDVPSREVTFARDVASIVYKHCAGCHRTGGIAPMSLLSFKDARPWAKSIREAVVTRQMPPWHADARYGDFVNDARLSETELDTIRLWVDQGAKEGNPADLPPAPVFNDDWRIGKPDLIIPIPEEQRIAAGGPDEYLYFTVPTHYDHDLWVQAVELRPGNRRVVHHAHVYLKAPESPAKDPAQPKHESPSAKYLYQDGHVHHIVPDAPVINDGCGTPDGGYWPGIKPKGEGGMLGSYLPGREPDIFPEGYARKIPAGAILEFQVHYSKTTGRPETDRTSVGFILAKEPPRQPLRRVDVSNYFFRIPPGASDQEVTACYTFDRDVNLLSYVAHMHYRGKDMRFDLVRPDGRRETLISIPHYNFNWQTVYRLRTAVPVEKGSQLRITAHFDNSPNNKFNPDPSKTIRWGEPSNEEMMDGWLEYVLPETSPTERASVR